MIQLVCDNSIGFDAKMNLPYKFNFATDIEIVSTWENLTDTCRITLPNKLRLRGRDHTDNLTNGTDALWKRGDPVTIRLGYQYKNNLNKQINSLNTVFTGKISRVYPDKPLIFECEDRMFDLKLKSLSNYNNKSLLINGKTTLDLVIKDIFLKAGLNPATATDSFNNPAPFTISCEPIVITGISFRGTFSLSEIINYFTREPFHLYAYFQNTIVNGVVTATILYIGFPYKLGRAATATPKGPFDFNKNIIDSDMDYMRGDDVRIQVSAININTSGNVDTKDKAILVDGTTVTKGGKTSTQPDPNAEQRTIYTINKTPAAVLDEANQYAKKFKYTGFRGSFVTFLQPTVTHGDQIKLVDTTIPDRSGIYLVKQVITKFGGGGGRQIIYLDIKVADLPVQ